MTKTILERYPRLPDGHYVIDINAGNISDLYDDYDRYAPYVIKDLDENLVYYISESARELGNVDYLIQFRLLEPVDEEMKDRILTSINSYFLYLRSSEIDELGRMMRTSFIFLVVGMLILFLSVWINSGLGETSSVLDRVLAEGLTVAAWVSLWEALATFLINWRPISRKIALFKRIANAPVKFA